MKVVIKQTKYCYDDEQIFKDYPILEKYRSVMDYYTGHVGEKTHGFNREDDSPPFYFL